ncbi:DNA polymerase theta [Colletotrichum spinosum]|uniref:DNA polymerase theta n=1 Tax=Colletotrichum spinosum TaxID=1347390 RepID=A0A4R8PQN5_9PEZI|nr:DNA polymerase theta [Colletotrichum spinosum]
MVSNNGLWHRTSVQAVKEQGNAYSTSTTVAGHKRARSEAAHPAPPPPTTLPGHVVPVQRASSLPPGPPRLAASPITDLDLAANQGPSEYTQRNLLQCTPSSTTSDPLLALAHPYYGLPRPLIRNFYGLGIKIMYPWQKACLRGPGLLSGEKNLVYSAPTGGGKSLVADGKLMCGVLMLKRVLEEKNAKVLLVLPYVALVQEKVRWLRNIVQGVPKPKDDVDDEKRIWRRRADEDTIRVIGFFGGSKIKPTWADFDVGVCTIEKANALVNTAIDDCSINHLKAVVLDELHMIDDDHRGYLMELMGTKLMSLPQPVQIIGMSATMSNIKLLANWLDAHSYETRYRPVPIEEHLVYEGCIYPASTSSELLKTASKLQSGTQMAQSGLKATRRVEVSSHKEFRDPVLNAVVSLASETARAGYGALVFASSRPGCESDARWIARVMPSHDELDAETVEKRIDLLAELRSLGTGIDPVLEETIPMGVVFHHVGYCADEGGSELTLPGRTDHGGAALLEVIAIRLATSRGALEDYTSKTLLAHAGPSQSLQDCVEASLKNLLSMAFVTTDVCGNYQPTKLGRAIVASALDPDDGVFIKKELERALQAFVMDGEMHILYTFTPVHDFGTSINWQVFRNEMENLDESGHRVLGAHGSTLKETTPEEKEIVRVHRRFYLAFQLRDLCNEMPIHVVARKYDAPRGAVQNLSQTCHGFAAGMIKFCEHMGWGIMAAALDHFSDRLKAGAKSDLLALAQITFVKSRTARVFWENGFRSVAAVANADPKELLPILMQASKESVKYEEKLMAKAQVISASANRLWQIQMQQEIFEEE